MPLSSRLRISTGPQAWIWAAPGCLPNPTTAIFVSPLSIGPLKQVCGLMRLTGMIRSAPAALRSRYSGMPSAVRATSIGLHRRPDLAVDRGLGHPERLQHRPLALGGGAAVAAHRRHDERLRAELAQPADRAAQQGDPLDQPAAAGADGDGHARR